MESFASLKHGPPPPHPSLNLYRSSRIHHVTALSFRTSPSLSPPFKSLSVRASFSSPSSPSNSCHLAFPNPKSPFFEILSSLCSPIIKTACIFIAAAGIFFLQFNHRPAFAAPAPTTIVESGEESKDEEEEKSKKCSDSVQSLRLLVEERVKAGKLTEAIAIIERLIELEPDDDELPVLKANIYCYMGEFELARNGFEEILANDPLRVEAYHGLVMLSELSDKVSLSGILKRIEDAMEYCKVQKNESDVRDFKLLIAQVKLMEESYFDALKLYQELVREEPKDFRPYLCQGIIYTLLKKTEEAEKQFEKFRNLVPKDHPFKDYVEDNMFATKLFARNLEMESSDSKS